MYLTPHTLLAIPLSLRIHIVQVIPNLIGRLFPCDASTPQCRHHGKKQHKHCMKCSLTKYTLYTVVQRFLLQRPALRRAIGLVAMVTFTSLALYILQAPLGANFHNHPMLDCAFVYTSCGTTLHDPVQHCTIASQENINQFVFCECAYAYGNTMQTTYLRYRKRLRKIFLYTSKHRFHRPLCLAWLLLLLLLCGDVEVNPGPRIGIDSHDEDLNMCLVESTSEGEIKWPGSFEQCEMEVDKDQKDHADEMEKHDQRLSRKRTLARARFAAETTVERQQRLLRSRANQVKRLETEDVSARQARLIVLRENASRRLAEEDETTRLARLAVLQENASHRRAEENETMRQARLAGLRENASHRRAEEDETTRQARLVGLRENASQRLAEENETMRLARLTVLQDNARQRLAEEDETTRLARLAVLRENARQRLAEEDETTRQARLAVLRENASQRRAKQTAEGTESNRMKARERMQILRKKRAALAVQKTGTSTETKSELTADSEESTMKADLEMESTPLNCVPKMDVKPLPKSDNAKKVTKRPAHNKVLEANRTKFRKLSCDGPSCVCASCHKLCYETHGTFAKDDFKDVMKLNDAADATWLCNRCLSSLKSKKIPGTALNNNMRVSEVPKELRGLNSLEERLISRVTPFMKLVVLPRGHQRAIRGQVINFPTPMTNTVDQLPRPAEDSDIVYVQRPSASDGVQEDGVSADRTYYCCRYGKVMKALTWLKENNPLYHDVKVVDPPEQHFQEESEEIQDGVDESGVVRSNTLMPDIPVSKLIQDGTFPVHQLERITTAPVSVFTEPQLKLMAFPALYPDGENGYGTHRNAKVTPLDYFQAGVMSIDARWAQYASYLFWACNIVEAYKLQSSISVALCLRNPGTRDSTKKEEKSEQRKEHCLTAGDLRSSSAEDNPDVRENCYSFMRDIRGTAAYWQAAKIQLFAMLRSLGPPTFFITFSADDHHWKDLMVVLAKCTGQNLTEDHVDRLTDEEKKELMASNPVVTARHFAHCFQCLVKEVIKGSGKPIGEVIDHFWRIEFQLRGSPHVHSLWWIKDAPDLDTKAGSQSASEFIDIYISVRVPDEGCGEDDLRSAILRVQQHKHTSTCEKTTRRKDECHFDFPRPLSSETRLKNNNDMRNKSRFYLLKQSKGDENVNAHNADLLHGRQTWTSRSLDRCMVQPRTFVPTCVRVKVMK